MYLSIYDDEKNVQSEFLLSCLCIVIARFFERLYRMKSFNKLDSKIKCYRQIFKTGNFQFFIKSLCTRDECTHIIYRVCVNYVQCNVTNFSKLTKTERFIKIKHVWQYSTQLPSNKIATQFAENIYL